MSRLVRGRRPSIAIALLVTALGCAGTGPAATTGDPGRFRVLAESPGDTPSVSPSSADAPLPFPFLNEIGLSSTQRDKIRAIIASYAPQDADAIQAWGKQFKAVMSRPDLDEAALRALLKTAEERRREMRMRVVPMIQEIRAVLDDPQRADAADTILKNLQKAIASPPTTPDTSDDDASGQASPDESPGPSPAASPEASPDESAEASPEPSATPAGPAVTLSEAQKKRFRAIVPPGIDKPAAVRAVAKFMRTGDAEPVTLALTPKLTVDEQVDAAVAALSSLTTEQRQALVNYQPGQPEASAAPGASPSASP